MSATPRLYLIVPPAADAATMGPIVAEALAAGDVACALVRLATRDEAAAKRFVRALAGVAAERGTALLVEDDPRLAARAGADGVHVRGVGPLLHDALSSLKPERIVGCGGLRLRHDAMLAGELGVDYVAFGEPESGGAVPPFDATLERTRWWAEIFNVPCVAYAAALSEVAELAAAGADFVAVGDWVWSDPRGAAVAVRAAQALLDAQRMAAPGSRVERG